MSLPQMRIALNVEPYYPMNARPRMWIQLGGAKRPTNSKWRSNSSTCVLLTLEILRYIVESLEPLPVPELISQTVITISTQRGYCGMCTVNPFCREVLADFLLIRKSGVFAARAHHKANIHFPANCLAKRINCARTISAARMRRQKHLIYILGTHRECIGSTRSVCKCQ